MGHFFGTDGIRGVANLDLTNDLAYQVGRYGAYVLTKHMDGDKARIIVGKDTRLSSDMLESAMIAGMLSVGCDVVRVGVVPTPAIAYLVQDQSFDAGVVISASHNSFEYNGIKFFNHQGLKLSDEIEAEIEAYLLGEREIERDFTHDQIGHFTNRFGLVELYLNNARQSIQRQLKGLKIALDCANGANTDLAQQVFLDSGAEVKVIANSPNGVNINLNCGSTHLGRLKELVLSEDFDMGLAFDGDGDRVLAIDRHGREVDGDKIMAIMALQLKAQSKLPENTVVATVMSNLGFINFLKEHGIDVNITQVGDRYVLEEMLRGGYVLGGEQSGHVIYIRRNLTGDGILTGLKLAEAVLASGKDLAEWNDRIPRYPQVLVNAKVNKDRMQEFELIEEINQRIAQVEAQLDGRGRVLIRPSGTEPLIRVMLEGENQADLEIVAREIAAMFEAHLK